MPDPAARADAVSVLAPGGVREELVERLGPDRAARLSELQVDRALRCAQSVFGAGAVSVESAAAGRSLGERAAAHARAAREGERVVVLVPELPVWREDVLRGALEDLDGGCALSVGALFAGSFYLVALTGPLPPALDLEPRDWSDRNVPGRFMLAAGEDGLDVGMLRAERGLRTAGDVEALLADPLTDSELRGLLGR